MAKKTIYIGTSEDGTFVLRGDDGTGRSKFYEYRLGSAGTYRAELVTSKKEMRSNTKCEFTCVNRLRIYDDEDKTVDLRADTIQVYSYDESNTTIYLKE